MKRLLIITAGAIGLLAQETPAPAPRSVTDPAAPARVGVGITERKLSLQQAIEMALANNLDIEIERTNKATAEQSVQAARGFFDPLFRWTPLFENRNTPVANVFQGAGGKLNDRFVSNNLQLQQKIQQWGSTLR